MGDANRLRRDELHRIAANERRRAIVATIRDRGAVTVDELVATVAEREPQPTTSGSIDRRTAIEVELLHVHIPMLRAAGVVDFDPTQRKVTPGKHLERVDELLSEEYALASP
ncbi:DUF7344 domain-containing protein [Halopiger xanaduensis]|uniref:DUF7344 domain-containing protein n=1 Tax=Halopiger xanaduensis (strain DSM 18323 / JCM 14033 / SH-6) TaxID=797210 RepID=F8D9Z6_HALXS|nr:hypothetical protein [Halopiger xanaduensis]AEH36912.1 hypothetical protein Halxa_2287 [Halopiger xanaduensis SH-6]